MSNAAGHRDPGERVTCVTLLTSYAPREPVSQRTDGGIDVFQQVGRAWRGYAGLQTQSFLIFYMQYRDQTRVSKNHRSRPHFWFALSVKCEQRIPLPTLLESHQLTCAYSRPAGKRLQVPTLVVTSKPCAHERQGTGLWCGDTEWLMVDPWTRLREIPCGR